MTYIFNITPIPAPRMVHSDRWAKREVVLEYFQYKKDLGWLAKSEKFKINDTLKITFYLPMPPSWSQTKHLQMNGQPHKQKPDGDNLVKAFLDALTTDDSNIWHVEYTKYWAEKGKIVVVE